MGVSHYIMGFVHALQHAPFPKALNLRTSSNQQNKHIYVLHYTKARTVGMYFLKCM